MDILTCPCEICCHQEMFKLIFPFSDNHTSLFPICLAKTASEIVEVVPLPWMSYHSPAPCTTPFVHMYMTLRNYIFWSTMFVCFTPTYARKPVCTVRNENVELTAACWRLCLYVLSKFLWQCLCTRCCTVHVLYRAILT